MANIKSQVKRARTNEVRRMRNVSKKSAMKTAIKQVELAISSGNKEAALLALPTTYKALDMAVKSGIVHDNYAARQKSRLTLKVNAIA